MQQGVYVFRRKTINLTVAMRHIKAGEKIPAKRAIESEFLGVTQPQLVSYGIMKLMEKSGDYPSQDELIKYVENKERDVADKKMAVTETISRNKKTNSLNTNAKTIRKSCPKCPTCNSTNVVRQGIMSRAISGALFGQLSVEGRAQFLCKNCGYMF